MNDLNQEIENQEPRKQADPSPEQIAMAKSTLHKSFVPHLEYLKLTNMLAAEAVKEKDNTGYYYYTPIHAKSGGFSTVLFRKCVMAYNSTNQK